MGWKAVKEHYRIEHDVQVVPNKGICIGSPYVHDLIVITPDCSITTSRIVREDDGDKLGRYLTELRADPAKLRSLLDQADHFDRSIPVFTYEGSAIVECQCEEIGWPNVTHDGRMMYENTFSADREEVVGRAIKSARSGIEWGGERVAQCKSDLQDAETYLARREADLASLLAARTQQGATP